MTTDRLLLRARALRLHGIIGHWDEVVQTSWINDLIAWEEEERAARSLERRLSNARTGRFKLLGDFDWGWPKKCDREAIEDCMSLEFVNDARNIILCGPNGVGKSTIARNIAHQAVLRGKTALFVTASEMLNKLASEDGDGALRRGMKRYAQPQVLVIDEVGYLSYSNRHADLLFEIISQRYQIKSTIITTNKPFSEWGDIFPNASCVVSMIDRLVHKSEIINIEADSYRLKEASEEKSKRQKRRDEKTKQKI